VVRLARFLARRLWWGMLWYMRRPWMKYLQRRSIYLWPPSMREKAQRSFARQNNFARRHGLTLLTGAIGLFLASLTFTLTYQAALTIVEDGVLTPPDRLLTSANN
jgi:hypothetical protein